MVLEYFYRNENNLHILYLLYQNHDVFFVCEMNKQSQQLFVSFFFKSLFLIPAEIILYCRQNTMLHKRLTEQLKWTFCFAWNSVKDWTLSEYKRMLITRSKTHSLVEMQNIFKFTRYAARGVANDFN